MTGARQPHILLVVENVALARDHRLQKQVSTLHGHGYRVTVVCRGDVGGPRNSCPAGVGLRAYRPPPDGTSKLGFAWEYGYSFAMAAWLAAGVFRRDRFDAIQVSGTPDIYFALAAPYRLLGRPLVLDQRDLSPELFELRYGRRGAVHRALRWLERRSYRAADQVITVNAALRDAALTRGGLPPEAVTVVGNGPVLASTRRRQPRLELKHGKPFLCCWLGHMGPQDRLDLALRAVGHLVHGIGRADCHFAFVGDGEARVHARRLAAQLRISPWVSFPGWAGQDEAFTYLSTADVGLEPNMEEIVSPVKGMEYMAFGLPFVTFDLAETRALAREAAVYALPGDVAGFARLIDELLGDPARRAALGRAGRRLIEERLAWDRQEAAYLGVYQRLLGKPQAEPPARAGVAGPAGTAGPASVAGLAGEGA
jgi:glycosyltransferase involved in cell wall biosynthesis